MVTYFIEKWLFFPPFAKSCMTLYHVLQVARNFSFCKIWNTGRHNGNKIVCSNEGLSLDVFNQVFRAWNVKSSANSWLVWHKAFEALIVSLKDGPCWNRGVIIFIIGTERTTLLLSAINMQPLTLCLDCPCMCKILYWRQLEPVTAQFCIFTGKRKACS